VRCVACPQTSISLATSVDMFSITILLLTGLTASIAENKQCYSMKWGVELDGALDRTFRHLMLISTDTYKPCKSNDNETAHSVCCRMNVPGQTDDICLDSGLCMATFGSASTVSFEQCKNMYDDLADVKIPQFLYVNGCTGG
jgi:hypothetical protein